MQGIEVGIDEILNCREKRVVIQNEMIRKYRKPIISFTMNIPGPIKTNDEIKKAFAENMTGTDRVMNKITKHILEHYMEPLDLDSLAKEFNYNYNYLSSYFNSKNKEGFSGYLNKIRIEKSCEILKKEDIPISDVSILKK